MSQMLTPEKDRPTVALLPWGLLVEDFLDTIGVSLEAFSTEMTGSWLFGYAEALRRAGVRPIIVLVSARVDVTTRYTHRSTGAIVCVLPAPRIYMMLRRGMSNPYSRSVKRTFAVSGPRHLLYPWFFLVKEIAPYLATPLRSLAGELRTQGCDAVICQEYEYPRFDICVALGRLLHIPVFGTFQGGKRQLGHAERFLRPLALRGCAGLTVAPRAEIERVRNRYGIARDRVSRVFNPIDLAALQPIPRAEARSRLGIPRSACVVIWHGRVEIRTKGLDVLLAAWRQLCGERPDTDLRLLLVGSGSEASALRDELDRGEHRGVFWLDRFVHDRALLGCYLSAADVYAFPSRREGFPVAPLEALAFGLPVVAADADGVPDIFEHGEADGGIVVPREQPEAMAAALGRLLDDAGLRRAMSLRARERARTFSLESIGDELRLFLASHAPGLRRSPVEAIS